MSFSQNYVHNKHLKTQDEKAQELKTEIEQIDNEVGQMAYELKGDVKIVEGKLLLLI
jgi:hypothetical protein